MLRILFVCTGNTCRSPLAEGLMRKLAGDAGMAVEVRSAGVYASNGSPISNHSAHILREKGASDAIRSSSIHSDNVQWADLILTMTQSHKQALIQHFPDVVGKTFTFKEYTNGDSGASLIQQEREELIAELSLKQALGHEITEAEKERYYELERRVPNIDISDPFGGSLERYRMTAAEIEQEIHKLISCLHRS
ncbi:low molecular weight protein arginine phosphatase [Paenibacillus sp. N1-5-1-14]|uniref:low molecular weight protein arginine phosphatase n=1 Tax=Paenibacillus radicibacter TaxID=2972488 RepID=UPI002159336F|nr:low molecular weight protein arginine phosphatase [Paenibacillus radicibacter]MCR8645103.1 low molecular weight protein arginine phosphatase [Paenibacillus radicibacter]